MNHLILSPSAGREIEAVFDYIANENVDAAVAWATALQGKLDFLARHPKVGRPFPELSQGVRAIPFGRYLVFFRFENEAVHVLHVLHGSRDFKLAWKDS